MCRRAISHHCGGRRESAKKIAASSRNLSSRRAASPRPPNRRTFVLKGGDACAAPMPVVAARSRARTSALRNSQTRRQRTGAERRARLPATAANSSRTTARRRNASWSFPFAAFQSITAACSSVRSPSYKIYVYVKDYFLVNVANLEKVASHASWRCQRKKPARLSARRLIHRLAVALLTPLRPGRRSRPRRGPCRRRPWQRYPGRRTQ
jgi:hypothetical protein